MWGSLSGGGHFLTNFEDWRTRTQNIQNLSYTSRIICNLTSSNMFRAPQVSDLEPSRQLPEPATKGLRLGDDWP